MLPARRCASAAVAALAGVTAALVAAACAGAPSPPGGGDPPPELRLPREVRPVRYRVELGISPASEGFTGAAAIDVELSRPLARLWLHARGLTVTSAAVEVNGARTSATLQQVTPDGVARLVAERVIPAGRATLHLTWEGAWDERLEGLYRVRAGADAYAFTQLEAIAARRVLPCFDEPAFKAPLELSLVVPAADVAVSNAPALREEPVEGGLKRVRFAATPPLPTYLFFAAVGPFDVVAPPPLPPNEVRGRPLPLRLLAPRGTAPRHGAALEATRELLPLLERWFGIPFPYEKLDQVVASEFAFGGMENAGAILYSDARLRFEAGRSPAAKRLEVAGLVAHELAHQWFGDLVTLEWWEDVWLNESFATFMTWKALERWQPDGGVPERIATDVGAVMDADALAASRAVRQPLRRLSDVWGQFDRLSYVKGASVLRGFERLVGEERFREGVRAYLQAHAHGTATTDGVLAALSRAAGRDLGPAFRSFLDQPGTPLVEARVACDAGGPRVELEVSRWRPVGSRAASGSWGVPVCARYEAAGTLGEACALVERGRAALPLPACPRWVMPAAGGTAPYRWALAAPDLARLRDAGFPHLEAAERVAYGQALHAAADAGRMPYAEALSALAPLARDGARRVATAPVPALRETIDLLVPAEARPRARAAAAELYRPRLRELGLEPAPGEGAERGALRREVVELLVLGARDVETTRVLAALGRAYAGGDGRVHPEAVTPELAPVALAAAVMEGDAAFGDGLEARLATLEDGELRGRLLDALAAARSPAGAARALGLAGDPRLRPQERGRTLFLQAGWPETRDLAWRAVESRWDALSAALLPRDAARLPDVAAPLCDASRLAALRRFFEARAPRVPGASRHAAEALERVELCAALRAAQGASAAAWAQLAGGGSR